jgi:hypothetical protein
VFSFERRFPSSSKAERFLVRVIASLVSSSGCNTSGVALDSRGASPYENITESTGRHSLPRRGEISSDAAASRTRRILSPHCWAMPLSSAFLACPFSSK